MVIDASCSSNLKHQLQCKCRSAWACSRQRNAFTSGISIKVDKKPRKEKNHHLLSEVCRCRMQTHCFCHAVNRKKFWCWSHTWEVFHSCSTVVPHLGSVPQFLFPLKKIIFCDSRLASCVLNLYLLIKFGI